MNLEAESLQTRPQFIQSVCRVRPPLLTNGERHIVVGSLRRLRHFLALRHLKEWCSYVNAVINTLKEWCSYINACSLHGMQGTCCLRHLCIHEDVWNAGREAPCII
jgi:hypothetical protein